MTAVAASTNSEELILEFLESGSLPERRHNRLSKISRMGEEKLLSRPGYTGEPLCFELFMSAEAVTGIWEKLHQSGISRGMTAAGLGARDTLR